MTSDGFPFVCDDCIGDETLAAEIRSDDAILECSFCAEERPAKPIGELASRVYARFRELYRRGEVIPGMDPGGDDTQPNLGKASAMCFQEMLGTSIDVVDAIVEWLNENDINDGVADQVAWSDNDAMFVELPPGSEHRGVREQFAWFAKHRARFFDPRLRSMLDGLFSGMDSFTQPVRLFNLSSSARSPFFTVYPEDDLAQIYRARVARTIEEALVFAKNAAAELGPPPPSLATPGRMNAGGISVFYGAFAEKTCVAELRLRVGGLAVVARFRVVRPLRLLDFTQFNQRFLNESVFAPDYVSRHSQLAALKLIADVIARPVQAHEELLDYVPTQLLAEYLREQHGLDGLVYPSAQLGEMKDDVPNAERRRSSNVVLFHPASRIATGSTIAATMLGISDDRSPALTPDGNGDSVRVVRLRGLDITYDSTIVDRAELRSKPPE